jgi:isochorismate synthase
MNGTLHKKQGIDVVSVLEKAIAESATFCAARFPGFNVPKLYTSIRSKEHIAGKAEFVVQPWPDGKNQLSPLKLYEADLDKPEFEANETVNPESASPLKETTFEAYQNQFDKYQAEFQKGIVKKAILSRIKLVKRPDAFSAANMFKELCSAYPLAFVYICFSPELGLWMGASPELLIKKRGNICETVSLAGTKPSTGKGVDWTAKEIEEQELVSEHIREALSASGIANFSEKGPETLDTGIVSHLKTTFRFGLNKSEQGAGMFIKNLHPTPAVAGLPVKSAMELISNTEQHNRGLYTGYLGEMNGEDAIELYVNLRCMQVGKSQIALYVGGGITSRSDIQAEWEETEHKAKTLLKFIHE